MGLVHPKITIDRCRSGFTGTSLWIAPEEDLIVGFGSNRVHPVVEDYIPNAEWDPNQIFSCL